METSTDLAGNTGSSPGVTLYAPAANKTLQGGIGNDALIGGPNDTLQGTLGSNTFVFNLNFGKDTINGFNAAQDVIAFDKHLFVDAAQVLAHTTQSGNNAVIAYDANNKVTLVGVQVSDLHDSDFNFF